MMSDLLTHLALGAIKAGARVPREDLLQRFLENSQIADLLARLRIDCVLDIGANKGQYAQRLRRMGFMGHIVSFEPIPADYAQLCKAAEGDPCWHHYNVALGSAAELKSFNVLGSGSTVYSSFLTPLADATPALSETIVMDVRTLDSLFPQIEALIGADARCFLKIDTQGFDLEVCKGAGQTIGRMLGLQSEISVLPLYEGQPNYIDALSFYDRLGFTLMNLAIVNRAETGGVLEYDCLMARAGALAN